MKDVCLHCHTPDYVNGFYKQYDDLIVLFNEKFSKPGQMLMNTLADEGLLTGQQFDEQIEWTCFSEDQEGPVARAGDQGRLRRGPDRGYLVATRGVAQKARPWPPPVRSP